MAIQMNCSFEPLRLLSDGKVMYCIFDGKAYKIHDSFIASLNIGIEPNFIDISTMGGTRNFVPGFMSTNLSFDVRAGKCEVIDNKDVLLDFFNSASIRDLFKAINKKIEQTR